MQKEGGGGVVVAGESQTLFDEFDPDPFSGEPPDDLLTALICIVETVSIPSSGGQDVRSEVEYSWLCPLSGTEETDPPPTEDAEGNMPETKDQGGNVNLITPPQSVYIVEDDTALAADLARFLNSNGYKSTVAPRFERILDDIADLSPDLVILDLGLPGIDGLVVCRELRQSSTVPVIVLTSRNNDIDEVMSMVSGADDFIPKPFSPQVLLARVGAVLRRSTTALPRTLRHRGVTVDLDKNLVQSGDQTVELTPNERKTLERLLRQPGGVISRQDLMIALWESGTFVDDNTLTVTVNRLRRTLESIGVDGFVRTVRGYGYRT